MSNEILCNISSFVRDYSEDAHHIINDQQGETPTIGKSEIQSDSLWKQGFFLDEVTGDICEKDLTALVHNTRDHISTITVSSNRI